VLATCALYGAAIVEALRPVLIGTLDLLTNAFQILDSQVAQKGHNWVLRTTADFARLLIVNGQVVLPLAERGGGWMEVSLTVGGILQYPAMLAISVLAWPATLREWSVRLLVLPIPVALLLLGSASFTLLAELWFPVHDELAPAQFWPLLAWSRFLMGGGGLVLALLLSALTIVIAAKVAKTASRVFWREPTSAHPASSL
jgi:hypothetical protein